LEGAGLGRSEDTNEDEGFEKALLNAGDWMKKREG
jgi:hypothetical protein